MKTAYTNEASRITELEHELAQVKMELETMQRRELLSQLTEAAIPVYITENSQLADRLFGTGKMDELRVSAPWAGFPEGKEAAGRYDKTLMLGLAEWMANGVDAVKNPNSLKQSKAR